MRPVLLPLLTGCLALLSSEVRAAATPDVGWPHWEKYVAHFMSDEGRIVSPTEGDRTTSEGQSYALFFALVNDDRARFDKLLRWTEQNLARGDLRRHLPSWLWGRARERRWRVLDANSAADADLWIAFDLLEAGRLWQDERYAALGQAVLANIRKEEVASLPGLGAMLLPAPRGFEVRVAPAHQRAWRLNPSYVPPQLLRRAAAADPAGPWNDVLRNSVQLVRQSGDRGLVADWVLYRSDGTFGADPGKGPIGSYDAIRVPLWTGLLAADDPLRPALTAAANGLLRRWESAGVMPERVDVATGESAGRAPPGFLAAVLPLASGAAAVRLEAQLSETLVDGLYGPTYYDQNLILFAHGFTEGRFRFAIDGSLVPRWGAQWKPSG